MTRHRNLLLVALAASLFLCSPAAAQSLDQLIGRWCNDALEYRFTREQITVTPLQGQNLSHGTAVEIVGSEPVGRAIRVQWRDSTGKEFRSDFEVHGNELVQLQQSSGDKGPRRVFHRCG